MTSGTGTCLKDTQETVLKERKGTAPTIPLLGGGSPALRNATFSFLRQMLCHLGDLASPWVWIFLWSYCSLPRSAVALTTSHPSWRMGPTPSLPSGGLGFRATLFMSEAQWGLGTELTPQHTSFQRRAFPTSVFLKT